MKKALTTLLALTTALLFVACGEEEDPEEVNDLPDWDYASSGDNTAGTDDASTVPDEEEAPDETPTDTATGPDDAPTAWCGNGFIEPGERCDLSPSDCAKINPGLTNIANCKPDCSGWSMGECKKKTDVWGIMTLDFRTDYILNESRLNDPLYCEQGLQHYDAFFGMYGDNSPLPAAEATVTWSIASNTPAGNGLYTTFIRQHSFNGTAEIYPYIEIEFPPGAITLTDYSVNSTDTIFFNKKMVRIRFIGSSGGSPCIVAMGFWGTVNVEDAWQVDPAEGGRIALVSANIEFYPPRELPNLALEEGDPLPDDLLSIMKYPECP